MSFAKKSQKKNVGTLEASSELLGCGADFWSLLHISVEGRHTTFAKHQNVDIWCWEEEKKK